MQGSHGLDALAALCRASSSQSESPTSATKDAEAAKSPKPESQMASKTSEQPILPKTTPNPTVSQPNAVNQAMAPGAAALGGNAINTAAAAQTMALMQQAAALQSAGVTEFNSMNAMQQMAYLQYMQLMQAAAMQAQMGGTGTVPQVIMEGTKLPLAVVGQTPQFASPSDTGKTMAAQQQKQQQGVQPQFAAAPKPSPAANSMQPPLPPSQVPASKTSISIPPRKTKTMADIEPNATSPESSQPESFDDKKQLKRAANRRSAQLSRKRKKQFIEELKEENDELRRKEQILKSIPDLIVVFDSSGKIWFVSHSVSRFLDYSPRELESSSFWDRLCDDSVRLLKAAFMDALAARKNDMDTAPLGNGVWELRLVDKDGTHKIVALNGVVHFTNDTPECVCSIRPREELPPVSLQESTAMSTHRNVSLSSGDNSSSASSSSNRFVRLSIKPQQSVISRQDSCMNVKHQISDTGSCAISESGSDE